MSKLFVAIPCQGSFSVEFNAALVNMMQKAKTKLTVSICKSPGVGISRNILTGDFLDTECDKMLMIDSDMLFTPENVDRISSHKEHVVGGLYSKKEKQGRVCCERSQDVPPVKDEKGLIPLRYIGTGFMCVTRHLVEEMIKHYPSLEYIDERDGRVLHDVWSVGVNRAEKRYLTEDWWFCHRALEMEYQVYGDSEVMLQHEGRAIYPLELNERPENIVGVPAGAFGMADSR